MKQWPPYYHENQKHIQKDDSAMCIRRIRTIIVTASIVASLLIIYYIKEYKGLTLLKYEVTISNIVKKLDVYERRGSSYKQYSYDESYRQKLDILNTIETDQSLPLCSLVPKHLSKHLYYFVFGRV